MNWPHRKREKAIVTLDWCEQCRSHVETCVHLPNRKVKQLFKKHTKRQKKDVQATRP